MSSNPRSLLTLKRSPAQADGTLEERLHKVLANAGLGSRRPRDEIAGGPSTRAPPGTSQWRSSGGQFSAPVSIGLTEKASAAHFCGKSKRGSIDRRPLAFDAFGAKVREAMSATRKGAK